MSFLHPLPKSVLHWLHHPRLPVWAAGVSLLSFVGLVGMVLQHFLGLALETRVTIEPADKIGLIN
jgi:hypothetical protein